MFFSFKVLATMAALALTTVASPFSDDSFVNLVARTGPTVPERDNVTGSHINGHPSPANISHTPINKTINGNQITGFEGAQAACDRGLTAWCQN